MKKILLLLALFVISKGYCQPVVNDELKSLIREGFTFYPDLMEMEQQMQTSEMRVQLARTARSPVVSGNATYNYTYPVSQVAFPIAPGQLAELKFQPYNNFNGYLGVNYALLDYGRIQANVQKAKEELNQSRHSKELAEDNLAAQVANIYYSIVFIKKNIDIQDSILGYLAENMKVTESRFRHGDALQVDVLNVQALLDNENNRKIDLQNSLHRNLNLLRYATGKDTVTKAGDFDFAYTTQDLENSLAEASRNNPQFLLAQDRIRIAQQDLHLSKVQRMPGLNLMATAGYRNGYQPDIYQLRFNYMAGAALSVPIYTGGRIHYQTIVSRSALRLSEMRVQTLENTFRKDIKQALDDIASYQERLKHVESQIEQAHMAQRITASKYKNGTATYLDLTSASANYQRAHATKLQYQYQLCQAYIELSRLTGVKYWQ